MTCTAAVLFALIVGTLAGVALAVMVLINVDKFSSETDDD